MNIGDISDKYAKYEEYFKNKLGWVNETLEVSKKTPYGKENIKVDSVGSYDDFSRLPILDNDQLFNTQEFLPGSTDGLMVRTTGGTTGGKKKEIYFPKEAVSSTLPEQVTSRLIAHKSAVLHKPWEITSYIVMDETMKRQCPNVEIRTYRTSEEAISVIKEYEVVYIVEQVSKLAELFYDIDAICKAKPELYKELEGKYVFVEVGAEPVTIEDFKKWYEISARVFKSEPDIVAIYGATQTLLIGVTPKYDLKDKEIWYRVIPPKLIEVLDEKGDLVFGKEGRVIVTPLHEKDYPGSIFVRFDTEDLAVMDFGDDGNLYISQIRRNPETGMISLYGIKFFVSEFYNEMQSKLPLPVKMQFRKIESDHDLTLKITLLSSRFSDTSLSGKVSQMVNEAILSTYHRINEEVKDGKIKIEIETSSDDPEEMQKGWQILK